MSAIPWVGHLDEAGCARRDVGGHDGAAGGRADDTLEDHELAPRSVGMRRHLGRLDARHASQRRRGGRKTLEKPGHGGSGALHLRRHAGVIVLDPANEAEPCRPPPDEGPEAHALYDAGDPDAFANDCNHCYLRGHTTRPRRDTVKHTWRD